MKKSLQSLVLLLMALMVPVTAAAAYEQLADGVYQDGSALYISSGVTSLGPLQVNPSVVYSFAITPPTCVANTFTGYGATLHMPAASYGAYFIANYWCNFANMQNDAVEPTGIILSESELEVIKGNTYSLMATVMPSTASLRSVQWTSTNPSVVSVNEGTLTALATGECDIIVTCLGLQAVCHVTVSETVVRISLDMHEACLLPNHSLTIKPTLDPPLEMPLKVTVSKPEVAAARLIDGVVQVVGLTEGSTMIVVSSVDGQAVPDACMITVYTDLGDVNGDGFVSISDVTALIDYLLSGNPSDVSLSSADCNQDGRISIADVTALIDYLLSGHWPYDYYDSFWVDLGLPSGTLWATMNVGAACPEGCGNYFAWGETAPKDSYSWSTYKWCEGDGDKLTKYCTNTSYGYNGFTDGKTDLDLEDDAAYVNWGPQWRMPTNNQIKELINKCTWTMTTLNGVKGHLVTGPNGKSIFLPAAGWRIYDEYKINSPEGRYWSHTLSYGETDCALFMAFSLQWGPDHNYEYVTTRCWGLTVRAVRVSQN